MVVSSILGKVIHFATLNTKQKEAWEKHFLREWRYQSNLGIHATHSPENGADMLISWILKLSAIFR